MRCPTVDDLTRVALALLPRGRAWRSHEGGPTPDTVLFRYWRSIADPLGYLHERLCALRDEFFCATINATRDDWMAEYGLPDDCDPFPDLCVKVAALGGATCEYLSSVAARAGWSITCASPCGDEAGCGEAGLAVVGHGAAAATVIIVVDAANSPAYRAITVSPEAGCVEAGQALRCDPLESLRCLIERIAHAHLSILYSVIEA